MSTIRLSACLGIVLLVLGLYVWSRIPRDQMEPIQRTLPSPAAEPAKVIMPPPKPAPKQEPIQEPVLEEKALIALQEAKTFSEFIELLETTDLEESPGFVEQIRQFGPMLLSIYERAEKRGPRRGCDGVMRGPNPPTEEMKRLKAALIKTLLEIQEKWPTPVPSPVTHNHPPFRKKGGFGMPFYRQIPSIRLSLRMAKMRVFCYTEEKTQHPLCPNTFSSWKTNVRLPMRLN